MPGRIIESHEGIIEFWKTLIETSKLKVPFEVVHIDAHPDFSVRDGLYLASGLLHMDSGKDLEMLKREKAHSGNYLTFAIAYGWIASLVWVHLGRTFKRHRDTGGSPVQLEMGRGRELLVEDLPGVEKKPGLPFKALPWQKYGITEAFDYMALSKSPSFTPPESDTLVSVIGEYVRQI